LVLGWDTLSGGKNRGPIFFRRIDPPLHININQNEKPTPNPAPKNRRILKKNNGVFRGKYKTLRQSPVEKPALRKPQTGEKALHPN